MENANTNDRQEQDYSDQSQYDDDHADGAQLRERVEQNQQKRAKQQARYSLRSQRTTPTEQKADTNAFSGETSDSNSDSDIDSEVVDTHKANDSYEVKKILDVDKMGSKRNGEIRWKVLWSTGEVTWEPTKCLRDGSRHALQKFVKSMPKKRKHLLSKPEVKQFIARLCDYTPADPDIAKSRNDRLEERHYVLKAIVAASQKKKQGQAKQATKAGVTIPNNYKQATSSIRKQKWWDAMGNEFQAFGKKGAWTLVPRPEGTNVVSVRWVYDLKATGDIITKWKARLVARGFSQQEGEDYDPFKLFAPTMKTKTLRLLTQIAAQDGADIRQFDISVAFLHALLDEDVYVEQPEGFKVPGKEGWVYKLHKAMYGLKQAPKKFSEHLKECLTKIGFEHAGSDTDR